MKKSQCPLTVSEWVQYITFETNKERYDYYNEEVSFLSKMVILLATITLVLGLLSIFNTFNFITEGIKLLYFEISVFFCVIILIVFIKYYRTFVNHKKNMVEILNKEGDIIEDILNGKLKDVDEINRKYMSIWGK